MSTSFINSENMLASLKYQMNEEMMKAAEPEIQIAVANAEKAIRRRLGAMFISLIEQSFSIERYGNDLRIIVKQVKEEKR